MEKSNQQGTLRRRSTEAAGKSEEYSVLEESEEEDETLLWVK